ncbi:hypothetical protein COB64_04505 [Candidatus Wolfebacteria bacterium]|nr:MAG: hypothetical protein COB64_04505 [Candidatus Wolfebacteria bacterium]
MIVKSLSRKDPNCFFDLPDYIVNETDRLYDKHGKSFLIKHNLRGDTVEEWAEQFRENDQLRKVKRSDSVLVYHEMLSWHKKDSDSLTMEKMKDMTEKYIQLKNPNGMYLAAPHYDKGHYHVHICTSGVEYKSGTASRISKKTYAELKQAIQGYQIQKYPELKSIERHGKGDYIKVTDREYQQKQKTGRENHKDELRQTLRRCFSFAISKSDFLDQLKELGLETYDRSGGLTGVWYEGNKFRFSRLGFDLSQLTERSERKSRLREIRGTELYRKR